MLNNSPKMKILAMQTGIPRLNQLEYKNNAPLAAGYLFSYIKYHLQEKSPEMVIMPRTLSDITGVAGIVAYLKEQKPDLLLVTLYLWNLKKSLEIVREIKLLLPELLVVYGGPEVNRGNEYLLNSGEFIIGVSGEGEIPLLKLLTGVDSSEIPGLIYRKNGVLHFNPQVELSSFKSEYNPYLSGMLSKEHDDCMFFETVRGCPFSCNFCYYNKTYQSCHFWPEESAEQNIKYALAHGFKEVFLLDPSFNVRYGFDAFLDKIISLNPDRKLEFHTELRVDLLKPDQIEKLVKMNLKGLEAGLQTINPQALLMMGRQQNNELFAANIRALEGAGVDCMVDLIIGLPGDDLANFKKTADWVKANNLSANIQVFNLSILPGTGYSEMASDLELVYQKEPPYYVLSTPTFSREEMIEAFAYASELFEIDFDPVHAPLLSTDFSDLPTAEFIQPPDKLPYISKIIVEKRAAAVKLFQNELSESATLHFKTPDFRLGFIPICQAINDITWADESRMTEIIIEIENEFDQLLLHDMLPYLNLRPDHYVNRDTEPFNGTGLIVSTRIFFILPQTMADSAFCKSLESEFPVYFKKSDSKNLQKMLKAGHRLYFTGDEQMEIFNKLKKADMLDYPIVFDSFKIEWQKIKHLEPNTRYFLPRMARI